MASAASGSSFIIASIIVLVSALAGVTFCADVEHGTVSAPEGSPPNSAPGSNDGGGPPSPPSPLPPSLQVKVRVGGSEVRLDLQRDQQFRAGVPVYELYRDDRGLEQLRRVQLREDEYSVYRDMEKEAEFMVFREKDENGTSHYELEGVVHIEGKLYDLKTTWTKKTPRNLTSTTTTTTKTKKKKTRQRRETQQQDDDHPVDDSADNDAGPAKKEEKEEVVEVDFEVTSLPEFLADEADGIPLSRGPSPTRKTMKATIKTPPPASIPNLPPPLSPSSSLPSAPPPRPLSTLLSSLQGGRRGRRSRSKRDVTQDVYIDVVALVDYGVYTAWYGRSNKTTAEEKKQDALEKIRRYYAFIMDGVDMLYKSISSLSYTITVRLISVVTATTAQGSDWTEEFRQSASQWDQVDASQALEAASGWAGTTDLLPDHDHLMVFTGYDLTKTSATGVKSNKITGLAYTATLCDTTGKATSIVEDLGGFQCIGTAAHELGHGLSAEHDGTTNVCSSEDRYVMSAGSFPVTTSNKLNPWKFSSCSVTYFDDFLTGKVRFSQGRTCVYNTKSINSNIPDVTSEVQGQLYDVDAQCRQVYGSASRLCRGPEFGEASDVCTDMFCYDPITSTTCYQLVAARGTTCGNRKWCESGQCVTNSDAPPADESCVHGDQPGAAFDGQNCSTFVDNFPGYCYQEVVRVRCCASCAKHYRYVTDCEYGDRSSGCSTFSCPFANTDYLQSCCGTCDHGSTFTTTTTTTTTPPTTTTSRTTTPTVVTTTSGGTCVDNTSVTINQLTCPELVESASEFCYDATVLSLCCLSCKRAHTGVAGCEYGDKVPASCALYGTSGCGQFFTDGSSYSEVCCATCATTTPTTTSTTTTPSTTTTTTTPTTTTTIPTTTTTTTPTTTTTTTPTATTTTTPTTTTTTPTTTTTTPTTTTTTPTTTTTTPTTTTTTTPTTTTSTTTTTTPTTTTTTPTTTTTTITTTTTTTTTTTPSPLTSTSPPSSTSTTEVAADCVDAISDDACTTVPDNPWLCYDDSIRATCCRTCTRLADARSPGCEYGDRRSDCADIQPNSAACGTRQSVCCSTCAGYDPGTGGASVTAADVTVYVIAYGVGWALFWARHQLT